MDTAMLLSRLRERDVGLWVGGDRLKCSAPAGALDDETRMMLASRKAEVMAFLRQAEALKSSRSTIVPIKPDGRRPPIFAVSGHGGDVFSLVALARHLDKEQPVLGVQPPGLDGTEPLTSVEALARFEIEQIRSHQHQGQYLIAGHRAAHSAAADQNVASTSKSWDGRRPSATRSAGNPARRLPTQRSECGSVSVFRSFRRAASAPTLGARSRTTE